MAVRGRRHSRWMRGGAKMAGACGAGLLKNHGGIRDLVNLSRWSDKPGPCGISTTCAGASGVVGHVVKLGTIELAVKPSTADSGDDAWIYVCGCRLERAGLRFNSQGKIYIPDSEDEEVAPAVAVNAAASMQLAPPVPTNVAVGVDLPPMVGMVGAAGIDVAPTIAVDGVAGMKMNPKIAACLAKKVLREDLHPEVAVCLADVLSKMEPLYHKCFIDMYKVMVPLFFAG